MSSCAFSSPFPTHALSAATHRTVAHFTLLSMAAIATIDLALLLVVVHVVVEVESAGLLRGELCAGVAVAQQNFGRGQRKHRLVAARTLLSMGCVDLHDAVETLEEFFHASEAVRHLEGSTAVRVRIRGLDERSHESPPAAAAVAGEQLYDALPQTRLNGSHRLQLLHQVRLMRQLLSLEGRARRQGSRRLGIGLEHSLPLRVENGQTRHAKIRE